MSIENDSRGIHSHQLLRVVEAAAQAALDGLTTLFGHHSSAEIATTKTYAIWGASTEQSQRMASSLHNPMIERASISNTSECALGR